MTSCQILDPGCLIADYGLRIAELEARSVITFCHWVFGVRRSVFVFFWPIERWALSVGRF